uniref:PEP-CTERM protein-sorting domain-containing protein n=1 Tax=Solibacter usitatus (strain Ellin6076) TaxID=234267 RepID=Q01TD1_SOLUE
MRIALLFPLCACLSVSILSAGTVGFSVSTLGPNTFHYNYNLTGFPFQANQELDIRFDPTIFEILSNPVAGSGFFLIPCCQPNNPPGAFGDYAILALSNISSPTGTFGVDVTMIGSAQPGTQPYFLNQLDANGDILFNIAAGFTGESQASGSDAPEPSTGGVFAFVLIAGMAAWAVRRRLNLVVRGS